LGELKKPKDWPWDWVWRGQKEGRNIYSQGFIEGGFRNFPFPKLGLKKGRFIGRLLGEGRFPGKFRK